MEENLYKNTAHLYDLDPRGIVMDDLPFYINYAQRCAGDILEVACGTGRVSIALAKAGFHVTGFDLSPEMIHVFDEKLKTEDQWIQKRVTKFVADMTDFTINKKFSLILIPFRAFQLLTKDHQQRKFLELVRKQLADDGIFILNTYRPYGQLDESWVQDEKEDWVVIDPKTKTKIRRTQIRRKIDPVRQITYPELIYYVEEPNGTINKYVEKLAMKYYYEDQLRELLLSSGFFIHEEFGYYDYSPIRNGPELIFVCSSTRS
jgi:SAM-dependent methyltransferase